ncbi:hypothetical protein SeLEV6574_g05011 [Synchytrium endobioticum]|uniref:Amino acid permease/ SLC12A domain-containing protein n=1 Tax=Synchytrium endobioticum TaxID=286115 RepID=A0A507CXE7_9FUNG|nr:hypothetical protein SeLEV6574_g05011 [Synchytrium endobioticum]
MVNIVRGYLEHDERPTYLKPPSKDKNTPMKRKADEGVYGPHRCSSSHNPILLHLRATMAALPSFHYGSSHGEGTAPPLSAVSPTSSSSDDMNGYPDPKLAKTEFIPLQVKYARKEGIDPDDIDEHKEPERTMGWISGANLVVGMMIGSGIFAVSGKVLGYVGSPGMALVIWLVGGLASFAGTFCYIELGTMLPKSGGDQAYLDVQFPRPRGLLAFLFCWTAILGVRPGSEAVDANIFGQYILFPVYGSSDAIPRWYKMGLAVFCASSLTLLNIWSAKWSVRVHDWLTFAKLGTIMAISLMGLVVATGLTPVPVITSNFSDPFAGTSTNGSGYALALFKIFWSYDGWNNLNYSLGELKDPLKNLPKSATVGVSLITFLYITTNLAYFVVLSGPEMIAAEELVAGVFFKKVLGQVAGGVICPVLVAMAGFGAVAAMMYSGARIIQASAAAGVLPFSFWLKKIHPRTGTPVNALLFNWVLVMLYILAPPPGAAYNFLVDVSSYPTWIFYAFTVMGLLIIRRTRPDLKRPFKVWTPAAVFFILVCLFLIVYPWMPTEEPYPYYLPCLVAVVTGLSGIPVWWMVRRKIAETGMDFGS